MPSCGVYTECPGVITNGSPIWLAIVWIYPHSLNISLTCMSSGDYSDYNSLGFSLPGFVWFSSMTVQLVFSKDSWGFFFRFLEFFFCTYFLKFCTVPSTTVAALSPNFRISMSWIHEGHWALLELTPLHLCPQPRSCLQAEIQDDHKAHFVYLHLSNRGHAPVLLVVKRWKILVLCYYRLNICVSPKFICEI